MPRRDAGPALLTILALSASGCGDGTGPGAREDDFETVTCGALALSASSGQPMERISLGRLPASLGDEPYAHVVAEASGTSAPAFVEMAETREAVLVVPVHPDGTAQGGPVQLRLTNGQEACAAQSFTIEALPAASGEFSRLTDSMTAMLERQVAVFGVTLEEVAATPVEELPSYLLPVAIGYSIVADPDNPQSLAAMAADGLDPHQEALLEGLLAQIDLLSLYDAPADPPLTTFRSEAAAVNPCAVIETVERLDECMRAANAARLRNQGATNRVLTDAGVAFTHAALVPGAGLVTSLLGAGIWVTQVVMEGTAAVLPSRFVLITFQYDAEIMEDDEAPGEWHSAMVTAASQEWQLDTRILEAIFQAVGLAGGYEDFLLRFQPPELDIAGLVGGWVLTNVVNAAMATTGGSGLLTIPAETFGPVDISAPQWSDQFIETGNSVELIAHGQYAARHVGESLLSVRSVDPVDGQFGYVQVPPPGLPVAVTVKQIQMVFSPDEARAEASDTVELTLTVENSVHPEMVEIDGSVALQGSATIEYIGDSQHRVTYIAPAEPDPATPDLVTVRHTATTGARVNEGERIAIATVRFGALTITPRGGCVPAEGTLQLTAELEGVATQDVLWDVDDGEIDGSGLYTAPAVLPADSLAMITAVSLADPQVADTVFIDLGCACGWDLDVGGAVLVGAAGDQAGFSRMDAADPPLLGIVELSTPDGGPMVRFEVGGPFGATGTWPVAIGGTLGLDEGDMVYNTMETNSTGQPATATISITAAGERLLRAMVDGAVIVTDADYQERREPFSAAFTVVVPPDHTPSLPGPYGVMYRCTIP